MTDEQLDSLERKIAEKYMHMVPWGAVIWGLGNLAIWLSLWPLVLLGYLPVWIGFIVASLNVTLSYLPSHEAQHNIIAVEGSPLRWLNELVGHLSVIPLGTPYRMLKYTHYEHHKHTNHPELDPDYAIHAKSDWHFLWKSILNRQPESDRSGAYPKSLLRTGHDNTIIDGLLMQGAYLTVLFALAWSGYAIEAALLWWVPRHIGITYIEYYLSWAPHHPGKDQGRYKDTRGFKSYVGNLLSLGMQYHIVHHLYPRIPLSKTPAAYRELRPILEKKGCDLGAL
ncbi:MAG: beta-carotene hydroxylase [Gammaproteobacteria bacterium]|nr:beta-carotene hydroxylase [Gammaproteobacteria bacterium]